MLYSISLFPFSVRGFSSRLVSDDYGEHKHCGKIPVWFASSFKNVFKNVKNTFVSTNETFKGKVANVKKRGAIC